MDIQKPKRASHTFTQHLCAEPFKVFPLLCPVRETEWAEGWAPRIVISESGVAEADCVFATPAAPEDPHETLWYITRHEPENHFVEMIWICPEQVAARLRIQLSATPAGTDARITYTRTSLGPRGDAQVESFTEERYTTFMQHWEQSLNHFLRTGSMAR